MKTKQKRNNDNEVEDIKSGHTNKNIFVIHALKWVLNHMCLAVIHMCVDISFPTATETAAPTQIFRLWFEMRLHARLSVCAGEKFIESGVAICVASMGTGMWTGMWTNISKLIALSTQPPSNWWIGELSPGMLPLWPLTIETEPWICYHTFGTWTRMPARNQCTNAPRTHWELVVVSLENIHSTLFICIGIEIEIEMGIR